MAKKKNMDSKKRVYKRIELIGTSTQSFEDAIQNAVQRAGETVSDLKWFEVKELRGAVNNQGIAEYQVVLVLSFVVH